MDYQFDRPIPGESLTKEPGNAPYERPPQVADPEEALMMHLQNLSNPEPMMDLIQFVERGFDVQTLTEGILRSAVLAGVHTVDVSLIIAPTIHEFITSTLDMVGVPYESGLEETESARKERQLGEAKGAALSRIEEEDPQVRRMMSEMLNTSREEPTAPVEEPQPQEMPAKPAGLMARRM